MDIIRSSDISPDVLLAKQRFGIVGNTPALIESVQRALKVAPIDLSVLITGESGAGKEFFPQIIHQFSTRKHSKYIAVNCGAIPEGTIDSELFGHEKGSFTGAVASRKGYFEETDGGTIFLDEVAELPLTTQARLLRVLESGEFLKVGSSTVQKTNIRVVAATNVDMLHAVAEGRFREDLFYRLSTVQINIPPLRARGNDIALLARKFAADFAEHYHMPPVTFSDDARHRILAYQWPGNVRQLKNVIEQIALFEAGTEVSGDTFSRYLPDDSNTQPSYTQHQSAPLHPTLRNTYEREREMLFNLIFSLKKEIADVRKMVEEANSHISNEPPSVIADAHSFTGLATQKFSPLKAESHQSDVIDIDAVDESETVAHDQHGTSLEEAEKEMIRRALTRNDGNRKATAKELKIAERTLYRKIKEYGLGEL